MYVGDPPPPRGARRLTARPADPQGLGPPRGGEPPPPPTAPQNCRTPLGVTHWLAAAPAVPCFFSFPISQFYRQRAITGYYRKKDDTTFLQKKKHAQTIFSYTSYIFHSSESLQPALLLLFYLSAEPPAVCTCTTLKQRVARSMVPGMNGLAEQDWDVIFQNCLRSFPDALHMIFAKLPPTTPRNAFGKEHSAGAPGSTHRPAAPGEGDPEPHSGQSSEPADGSTEVVTGTAVDDEDSQRPAAAHVDMANSVDARLQQSRSAAHSPAVVPSLESENSVPGVCTSGCLSKGFVVGPLHTGRHILSCL